jgi:hypothetical protein
MRRLSGPRSRRRTQTSQGRPWRNVAGKWSSVCLQHHPRRVWHTKPASPIGCPEAIRLEGAQGVSPAAHLTAAALAPTLLTLAVIGLALAGLWYRASLVPRARQSEPKPPANPLELSAALIFAALFVLISLASTWVRSEFAESGLFGLAAISEPLISIRSCLASRPMGRRLCRLAPAWPSS